MFSGIVEQTGFLKKLERSQGQWLLEINVDTTWKDLKVSESLCVSGVCLTVTAVKNSSIFFDLLDETYERTNLKWLKTGDRVNLERALRVGDRLGGHFVTGHVDGTGQIKAIDNEAQERSLHIDYPLELASYLVKKGSVTVEGVSLTLGEIDKNSFEVYLIPYTLNHTNLGRKKLGDWINLEVDILARYAKNPCHERKESRITEDFLKEHGFIG